MNEKRVYFEYEETTTKKKKGFISIDMDYTQVYHNIMNCVVLLDDKWALRYLFWILPQANEANIIPHSKKVMEEFVEWVKSKRTDEKAVAIKTVQDAVSNLVKQGIIIKYGYGYYMLNPKVLWGDDIKKRVEYLIMEAKSDTKNVLEEDTVTYTKRIDG